MSARRALAEFRAPDEVGAEDRAWEIVHSAYPQPRPAARRPSYRRPVAALAVGVLLMGALALSPAGAKVGRLITRALGVQHTAPRLLSLPAPGRLLISGPRGTWTVAADGSARRLGGWTQASWSPHGLYLAVVGEDELAAVNPAGRPQWTLPRPDVTDPRWYAPSGYRVAYLSGDELRVVAGDGTGDHLLAARVALVAPAWRPGHPFQLAYLTARGTLVVRDADTGATIWTATPGARVRELAWSADGQRLLGLSGSKVLVYTGSGRVLSIERGSSIIGGALSPDGHALALVSAGASDAVTVERVGMRQRAARRVLAGPGLGQVAWSPNGQWLLISWPAANQWVFVRVIGPPRLSAVSRISQQFATGVQLDGWCCSATGASG